MKKYIRFGSWLQGRYFFGFGFWPIHEYNGVGFALVIFFWEIAIYINPKGEFTDQN